MILQDFHVHTTFSDGKNTPEEMVQAAIQLGMQRIGFSDHSYTFFDPSYCIAEENQQLYVQTVAALKEKYAGQIEIFCGIEQDFYALADTKPFDYVIGSVHYVKIGDTYLPIDESHENFLNIVNTHFGGDPIALAEVYFRTVAEVVEKTNADIIGHFDLVCKYNDAGLFDESDARYVAAWQAAVDCLLPYGKPFEVNTGAVCRGYKKLPYPSAPILQHIKAKGGKLIASSDSHSTQGLCFAFGTLSL